MKLNKCFVALAAIFMSTAITTSCNSEGQVNGPFIASIKYRYDNPPTSLSSLTDWESRTTVGFYYSGKLTSIDWGDGKIDKYYNIGSREITHTYTRLSKGDEITISIVGDFLDLEFGYAIDPENDYIIPMLPGNALFREVTIEEGVTSLPDSFLGGCYCLNKVNLPKSLLRIGELAFGMCPCIESIELPNKLYIIEDGAFFSNTSLKKINIPNSVASIGNGAFGMCTSLNEVTLSNSLYIIEPSTFAYCSSLKNITIPDSVNIIGRSAFLSSGLENITSLSSKLTEIGIASFYNCKKLKRIDSENRHLPNTLLTINDDAFYGCEQFEGFYELPDSLSTIGSRAFVNCTTLNNLVIKSSVKNVGERILQGCYNLEKVKVPFIKDSTPIGWDENWSYGLNESQIEYEK